MPLGTVPVGTVDFVELNLPFGTVGDSGAIGDGSVWYCFSFIGPFEI